MTKGLPRDKLDLTDTEPASLDASVVRNAREPQFDRGMRKASLDFRLDMIFSRCVAVRVLMHNLKKGREPPAERRTVKDLGAHRYTRYFHPRQIISRERYIISRRKLPLQPTNSTRHQRRAGFTYSIILDRYLE